MSWDDIAAKLDRIGDHLKAFNEETERFLNSDVNGVINDFDSEPDYLIVKAFSRSSPPKHYSVLVGEILYHLRSALDYLACQLTRENGGVCDSPVEFPIWVKPTGFGTLGDSKAWNFSRIGQMDMTSQELIKQEQPFQKKYGAIENDPLTWLYHLSNIDRHRFLHVATAAARIGFIRVDPAEAEARFSQVSTNYGPVKGETEVARYAIVKGQSLHVKVDSNVQLDVAFGDGGPLAGRFVSNTLGSVGMRVAEIIQLFKP